MPVSGDVSYDFAGLVNVTFEFVGFHGHVKGITFETHALSHEFHPFISNPYILLLGTVIIIKSVNFLRDLTRSLRIAQCMGYYYH